MIAHADPGSLHVTDIKTANYAAEPGELVQCNASGGSFTIGLPANPRVNEIVGVKLLDTTGANSVTVARSGYAIEGEAGGLTLAVAGEYAELQYAGAGTWLRTSDQPVAGGSPISTITANTTLTASQETVLCNNASNISVTLPGASASVGKRYTVKKVGSNNATVTIAAASGETIDGATSLLLYVKNDFVGIISDGSNWYVTNDGRLPHGAAIYRSTAQSIPDGTQTRVNFNSVSFDIGGIANTQAGRIDIRRSGRYQVFANYFWWYPPNTVNNVQVSIFVNGLLVDSGVLYAVTAEAVRCKAANVISLNAGDYVDLYLLQASGAARDTLTASSSRPELVVQEVR